VRIPGTYHRSTVENEVVWLGKVAFWGTFVTGESDATGQTRSRTAVGGIGAFIFKNKFKKKYIYI
jgi:hypothetical protein